MRVIERFGTFFLLCVTCTVLEASRPQQELEELCSAQESVYTSHPLECAEVMTHNVPMPADLDVEGQVAVSAAAESCVTRLEVDARFPLQGVFMGARWALAPLDFIKKLAYHLLHASKKTCLLTLYALGQVSLSDAVSDVAPSRGGETPMVAALSNYPRLPSNLERVALGDMWDTDTCNGKVFHKNKTQEIESQLQGCIEKVCASLKENYGCWDVSLFNSFCCYSKCSYHVFCGFESVVEKQISLCQNDVCAAQSRFFSPNVQCYTMGGSRILEDREILDANACLGIFCKRHATQTCEVEYSWWEAPYRFFVSPCDDKICPEGFLNPEHILLARDQVNRCEQSYCLFTRKDYVMSKNPRKKKENGFQLGVPRLGRGSGQTSLTNEDESDAFRLLREDQPDSEFLGVRG